MGAGETSLGGPGREFPKTAGDMLSKVLDPSTGVRRAGFEDLSRRYWKPVYYYVRLAWAKTNEDAKDLTQAFFLWLLESGAVGGYDAGRGTFRRYLKVMLRSFVSHRETALSALKRGGGVRILSLEGSMPQVEEVASDPRVADPEKAFESRWLIDVIQAATDRVRERHHREGKAAAFEIYKELVLDQGPERPSYAELAARLGLELRVVESQLRSLRQEIRRELRAELFQTTTGDRELEEEWNELFGK